MSDKVKDWLFVSVVVVVGGGLISLWLYDSGRNAPEPSTTIRVHATKCDGRRSTTFVMPEHDAITLYWNEDWYIPQCFMWNQSSWWNLTVANTRRSSAFITMAPVERGQ